MAGSLKVDGSCRGDLSGRPPSSECVFGRLGKSPLQPCAASEFARCPCYTGHVPTGDSRPAILR